VHARETLEEYRRGSACRGPTGGNSAKVKALRTGTTLRVVQEIHEDERGAALRFQQGGQGRLAAGDGNYATHLRLARRSQERHHPVAVTFGEQQTITEVMRADNDVPNPLWEEEPGQARVLDGIRAFS
jgi:hypothetical protein